MHRNCYINILSKEQEWVHSNGKFECNTDLKKLTFKWGKNILDNESSLLQHRYVIFDFGVLLTE